MKVALKNVSVEDYPLTYIGKIAGWCTGKEKEGDPWRRALACLRSGHASVFEHVCLTWDVRGVSRALTHQLVRHRMASYTQESQRYAEQSLDGDWYVTPPSLDGDARYAALMEKAAFEYVEALGHGVPAEDARYLLPNAAKTNIVVTMNLREFMHFYKLRADERAQWEIRDLGHAMLEVLAEYTVGDEEWLALVENIRCSVPGDKGAVAPK